MWFPTIPKAWFGSPEILDPGWQASELRTRGKFNYPGPEYRNQQLQHIWECLKPSERPLFCFTHLVLPHYPWTFLPSGDQYQSDFSWPSIPAGSHGELGEVWDDDPQTVLRNEHRYRLQVGYVDRFIGQLLDRLQESKMLNESLLIVTADHGVSFRSGHSRRVPDADNLADIVSIPLFIKYPGQTEGRIDDRNIESVDLLPTVADVLGLQLPEPVDGTSALHERRRPRKTFYYNTTLTAIEPDVPQRLEAVRRQHKTFGSEKLEQRPSLASLHPDWQGRSITEFLIGEKSLATSNPGFLLS